MTSQILPPLSKLFKHVKSAAQSRQKKKTHLLLTHKYRAEQFPNYFCAAGAIANSVNIMWTGVVDMCRDHFWSDAHVKFKESCTYSLMIRNSVKGKKKKKKKF